MAKEYRVLRGLNYRDPQNPGSEKRAERGDMIGDAPKHGTGRCESSCKMQGDHDWLLTGPDPVLEDVDSFLPPKEG